MVTSRLVPGVETVLLPWYHRFRTRTRKADLVTDRRSPTHKTPPLGEHGPAAQSHRLTLRTVDPVHGGRCSEGPDRHTPTLKNLAAGTVLPCYALLLLRAHTARAQRRMTAAWR